MAFERDKRLQKIHDEVIDALVLNELTPTEIARKYNLNRTTVSNWRSRAKKKRRNVEHPSPEVAQKHHSLSRATVELNGQQSPMVIVESVANGESQLAGAVSVGVSDAGETLKRHLIGQAKEACDTVAALRHKVPWVLADSTDLISQQIHALKSAVENDQVVHRASFQGEISEQVGRLTIPDHRAIASALKDLIKQFADLHGIPMGALALSALKPEPVEHKHLHLHSHGRLKQDPGRLVKLKDADIIEQTPSGESELKEWQRRLIED